MISFISGNWSDTWFIDIVIRHCFFWWHKARGFRLSHVFLFGLWWIVRDFLRKNTLLKNISNFIWHSMNRRHFWCYPQVCITKVINFKQWLVSFKCGVSFCWSLIWILPHPNFDKFAFLLTEASPLSFLVLVNIQHTYIVQTLQGFSI